ncbi:MAG: replicative DNA helicase, partial [Rhodospirillaceae bacterium]|nr:replicative DNA helicase [Rhodospirillaceae bacterium]
MSSNITPHPAAEAETEHSDRASGLFRTLPHNVEAEKALLGAIFANNKAYEKVSEFLLPEHFAMAENGLIFGAASRLIERGQIANPVTMTRYFEQDENLTDVGGQTYLSELA